MLKMEAICSSETLIKFQLTTQRYILEDRLSLAVFHLKRETEVF
jgi:hypothetical protein